jgi:hypothetical protein
MKIDNLKPQHLEFLEDKYSKLYNKKFPWANDKLIESMIKTHIERVVEEIDETEYLSETQLDSLGLK